MTVTPETLAYCGYLVVAAVCAFLAANKKTRPFALAGVVLSVGYRIGQSPTLLTVASFGVVILAFLAGVFLIGGKVSAKTFYPTVTVFAVLPISLWVYPLVAYLAMLSRSLYLLTRKKGSAYTFLVVHDSVEALGVNPSTLRPSLAPKPDLIPSASRDTGQIRPLRYLEISLIFGILALLVRDLT